MTVKEKGLKECVDGEDESKDVQIEKQAESKEG